MIEKEAAIEQINLGFNPQEDRLLLKVGLVGKTEVAVWITRRVCKMLWNLLQNAHQAMAPTNAQFSAPAIVTPEAKNHALESFAKEANTQKTLENLDFKSEYVADRQPHSPVPLLATQCLTLTVGNLPPQLDLQCSNGQSVKMPLTNELLHALIGMMQLATREAHWDIVPPHEGGETHFLPNQQTVH